MITYSITIENMELGPKFELLKKLLASDEIKNLIYQGASIIMIRAVEILRENGHVVSGTLWRSIHVNATGASHTGDGNNSSPILVAYQDAVAKVATDILQTEIGSWVVYAQTIENLPDGGYLTKAFEEKFPEVQEFIVNGLKTLLDL